MRLALLTLVLGLVACDAVLGIETFTRGNGATPVAYAAPECGACVAKSCAPERAACSADAPCDGLQRCLAGVAPNDVRHRMQCADDAPIAFDGPRFGDLDRCIRTACTESCVGVRGLGAIFGKECACLDDFCRDESVACLRASTPETSGVCERNLTCVARRGLDPDTLQLCTQTKIKGDPETGALRRCFAAVNCPGCPLASEGSYACLNRYKWTPPSVRTAKLEMQVTTFDSARTPIEGVKVLACDLPQCGACTTSLAGGTTDKDGAVAFAVPTGITGFSGCIQLEKDGLVPMIVNMGHPMVRDTALPMFMVATGGPNLIAKVLGVDPLPDRGTVLTLSIDCAASLATGVSIDVDPKDENTRIGYYVGNTLDTKAKGTGALGVAIAVNVLPTAKGGLTSVLAYRDGALLARNYVQVDPQKLTVLVTYPHPTE